MIKANRQKRSLLLMLVCAVAANTAADSRAAVWEYSKTADPINGGSIAIASVTGESVQALVRCWTNTGELDVSFLLSPGVGRADSNSVLIGFDRRRDVQRIWRVSPSGLALSVPATQKTGLLQRMRDAGNMRLQVSTNQEPAALLAVPLRGSSRAIGSVLQVCK